MSMALRRREKGPIFVSEFTKKSATSPSLWRLATRSSTFSFAPIIPSPQVVQIRFSGKARLSLPTMARRKFGTCHPMPGITTIAQAFVVTVKSKKYRIIETTRETSYVNPRDRGLLGSLSKSCSQLRNEITTWRNAAVADVLNTLSFGIVHTRYTILEFRF
jgi:hypothetical protein